MNPDNPDDRFRRTVLENEQAGILTQIKEAGRLQRQAEEVADVQLPEDYDARWGVTGANGEIRNLISQVKEYAFAQHNDELATLIDEYVVRERELQEQLQALSEQATETKRLVDDTAEEMRRERSAKHAAVEGMQDAEQKRDNAVAMLEESQAEAQRLKVQNDSYKRQIDELEGMMRTYRSRQSSGNKGGMILTSTLPKESDEDREERLKREKLEQLNRQLQARGIDPLPVPPLSGSVIFPSAADDAPASVPAEEVKPADERFSTDAVPHDSLDGQPADGAVALSPEEVIARFTALEGRIERLEAQRIPVMHGTQSA
ncbi:hypothetical protein CGZ75_12230 [Paenibacillus herberti]|uniref:Uncharacterized protein n=1 Tax=Paenibacillus herberti TaxID=1619309 RepID=A0A229P5V1_9BACL|nr:hypothetical protein CGZ75_12230 [Paenibacillus herberti]